MQMKDFFFFLRYFGAAKEKKDMPTIRNKEKIQSYKEKIELCHTENGLKNYKK